MRDATIEKGMKYVEVRELIKNRVVVFDGAMGTMLQKKGLKLGENPEIINFTNEDIVVDALGINCSLGPKELLPILNSRK